MLAGNFEYLVSSLPLLKLSNSKSLKTGVASLLNGYAASTEISEDLDGLLTVEVEKFLRPKQRDYFRLVQLNTIHWTKFHNSPFSVISEFSQFMYSLKSELRQFRMTRKLDSSSAAKAYELLPEPLENPLKAEKQLLQIQWQKLEDLSLDHFSDFSALLLYKLKLQLLERWWSFNREIGLKKLEDCTKIALYG